MTVTEQRYLDSLESMTEDVNMYAAPCFEFRGRLDIDALTKAYHLLSLRHPVIRGFVTTDNDRYILEVREEVHPNTTSINGGKRELRKLIDNGLLTSAGEPDENRPTSGLFVITNEHGGYIILRLRHSICDPTNTGALLSQLLDIYTDVVNDNKIPPNVGALPRSPLSILKEQWGDAPFYFNCPDTGPVAAVEGFCLPINFCREDTEALILAARQHRTTLGAVLLGEIVLALKTCDPDNIQNTVRINTLVSLRNRLDAPVGETETTYLTGRCIVPVHISSESNAVAIGKEFKSTLQEMIDKKEVYVAGYSMDTLGSTLNSIADIRFNSAGKFQEIRTPKDMDIVDFVGLNFPPGEWRVPHSTSDPILDTISWSMHGKLTLILRGRMGICSIVPELENRLGNIVESMSVHLEE